MSVFPTPWTMVVPDLLVCFILPAVFWVRTVEHPDSKVRMKNKIKTLTMVFYTE